MSNETVEINIPSDAIRLTGIVDIRNWLLSQDALSLNQFTIDWIERYVDRAIVALESEDVDTDDETFRGSIHYEVQTILAIMRADVPSFQFFRDLEALTRSSGRPTRTGD